VASFAPIKNIVGMYKDILILYHVHQYSFCIALQSPIYAGHTESNDHIYPTIK